MTTTNVPDAGTLAGLLADEERRRVFAGLVLGADSIEALAALTGLDVERVGRAVARLASAGLVIHAPSGGLHLLAAVFADAARGARAAEPKGDDEHAGRPVEEARVMRAFVRDGRLVQIPTSHSKRMVVLDWLAQEFEIGRRYSEPMVNLTIGRRHPDTAALRRYLVDEGFLSREDGVYWRSGGSVPTGSG